MRRRHAFGVLALVAVAATASGCTALVRLAAGPPDARARPARLALDATGQPVGVALGVDLYNPNPLDLHAARFDYRIEAGGASLDGSVPAQGQLVQEQWAPVALYVPIERTSPIFRAIAAREPYVVTGALVLDGGMSGLAVGVSGEGVIGEQGTASGQHILRVAFAGNGGAR
jgi:hypothetical protein